MNRIGVAIERFRAVLRAEERVATLHNQLFDYLDQLSAEEFEEYCKQIQEINSQSLRKEMQK